MFSNKKISISLLLISSLANAHNSFREATSPEDLRDVKNTFLVGSALAHHRDLGKLAVHRNEHGYVVFNESKELHYVQPHNVDKDLRSMTPEELAKIAATGSYLSVNKKADGQYTLALHNRLRGGGIVTGWVLGWGTRVLCYGAIGASAGAAVTVVVGSGGAVAAGLSSVATSLATGTAVGTANVAAGAVSAMVGTSAAATEVAVLSSAALVTEAAAIGVSVVAYVEGAAVGAQVFGTALWFLP